MMDFIEQCKRSDHKHIAAKERVCVCVRMCVLLGNPDALHKDMTATYALPKEHTSV